MRPSSTNASSSAKSASSSITAVGGQCSCTRSSRSTPRFSRERSFHSRNARRRVLGVLLRHAAPHLRRDERPLTGKLREHAADQALAAAVAVDVGGVDERDAGLERGLNRLDAVALADVAPVAAELPRAEADARDGPSEPWDLPLLHGGQPSGAPAVCQRFSSGARHPPRMTW